MQWSDEDGGWLEAPHYAMVSLDCILGGLLMASNAGYGDFTHETRVRKVMEWFAKISTPRDPRTLGFRHLPPIGNTYWGERTAMFGIIAGLWKERDPEFAANMQWMYEEQGKPGGLGGGWSFPTMVGNTQALLSRGVPAKQPAYGSAWFRQTGVVLRNSTATDHETYLHLIAGQHQSHYDYDSGSITLWGKGALISDDWGYIGKHGGEYHSLQGGGGGTMAIQEFSTTPAFDYVSGRSDAWQRQIAFAKDPDPLAPNFFLLRDANDADAGTSWRLWLTAKEVKITPTGATVDVEDYLVDNQRTAENGNRVALDVFCYQPERLKLATRVYEQNVGTAYRDGKEGPIKIKQTCLTANQSGHGVISALLYPRLTAERAPTVTWFADGRIAQVDSIWGDRLRVRGDQAPARCRSGRQGAVAALRHRGYGREPRQSDPQTGRRRPTADGGEPGRGGQREFHLQSPVALHRAASGGEKPGDRGVAKPDQGDGDSGGALERRRCRRQ